MAERSFKSEVELLRLGADEVFRGEGILAVTKALLQSGVAYIGGYQGAPVSHLIDVFNDADPLLKALGVHFEHSGSEVSAAAMLGASISYPLRGAVAWKSTAGTNVASDALSNLASAGVTGGTLIIVGEDYGDGSSIMQERTHAFAMKSQMWLLDPRPNLTSIVDMVEHGFALSEASNTPVMLELRIRACHVRGSFVARDNRRPDLTVQQALADPQRDLSRYVLPPATFRHEKEKVEERWPAAIEYIRKHGLNEHFDAPAAVGLIVQGGLYNTLLRALGRMGLANVFGDSQVPIYVLNVTYPLVDEEVVAFAQNKRAILVLEEGQPDFIEQGLSRIFLQRQVKATLTGKAHLPMAGEYTAEAIGKGLDAFLTAHAPETLPKARIAPPFAPKVEALEGLPARPPGFCTGCPERPVFSAMKLLKREIGDFHVAGDIGCHSFASLPPFNIGGYTMGYGLGIAGAAAFSGGGENEKRAVSLIGDGGFWHNGLTSGLASAVYNDSDNVVVVLDNGYAAGTGGQDLPSSRADVPNRTTGQRIQNAAKGVGVQWVKSVRTYDVVKVKRALKEAMTSPVSGTKVIVAESECMLNKQRRERPKFNAAVKAGRRTVRERFGVDPETCTGDHSCIRLSGCPSLTIKENPDPLRRDPVAHVDNSCVGCGLCGANAHAAVLCPSFFRAEIIYNETPLDRWRQKLRDAVIGFFQRRTDRRLEVLGVLDAS